MIVMFNQLLYFWVNEWPREFYLQIGVLIADTLMLIFYLWFIVKVSYFLKIHGHETNNNFNVPRNVPYPDLPPRYETQVEPPPSYDALFNDGSNRVIFVISKNN